MLQRVQSPAGPVFYVSPLLAAAGVPHAFSTRVGGVSGGIFSSLNLGNPSEGTDRDSSDNIETNYRNLSSAAGLPPVRCSVHQVHGPAIVEVVAGQDFTPSQKADGLVTADPMRTLSIRVADCVPVLLSSKDGRYVAAVHAGWRGVIAGAAAAALTWIGSHTDQPCIAAIGPSISAAHFQVGPEVIAQFRQTFGPAAPIARETPDGKGYVDLRAALTHQLGQLGLSADRIDQTDRCSFEHADEFFSHRRDHGVTGRMAAMISPRPS